ncbi:endonuclease 8-like 2 [Diadema setosum]|uniref:endonuclease 8-like 2 n=1 Tax=Diadema setosum TaxID=31175 RepID=UPI003B3BDA2F
MPEGPSLRRWCTQCRQFVGRNITRICGSSKAIDHAKWCRATLSRVEVYGKQLFLRFSHDSSRGSCANIEGESTWIRCHFLMWGSVRVNEYSCKPSKTNRFPEPRLVLFFSRDEYLVFYGGSFHEVESPPEDHGTDILSDTFDVDGAVANIMQDTPIACTLMDQGKFSGLGNIIKNEVLFATGLHPMTPGTRISRSKAEEVVRHAVDFSKRWLTWKMEEQHSVRFGDWTSIYKKGLCPAGHTTRRSLFGPNDMERITYWCPTCQPEVCCREIAEEQSSVQTSDDTAKDLSVNSMVMTGERKFLPSESPSHASPGRTASSFDLQDSDRPLQFATEEPRIIKDEERESDDESVLAWPQKRVKVESIDPTTTSYTHASECGVRDYPEDMYIGGRWNTQEEEDGNQLISIATSTLRVMMKNKPRIRLCKVAVNSDLSFN